MFQWLLIKYKTLLDDDVKWMHLPYYLAEAEREKHAKTAPAPGMKERMVSPLLGAFAKVHRSQARFDQRVSLLRVKWPSFPPTIRK